MTISAGSIPVTTRPRAGDPVLEVRGLSASYGLGPDAVRAVVDVDLTLRRGEILGIAGESGSGKSTLAYAITRLLRPPGVITAGEVVFRPADRPGGGMDLLSAGPAELRAIRWSEIAVVFQSAMHALNPVLTVERQLLDVLAAHRRSMSRQARQARVREMVEMVGISPSRLKSYPHELSGGMRQRVMIAMGLILEPQIVLMDEPTTALDVVTQRQILQQILELRERLGFSVVFITHDLSLLIEIADTIAIMYAGRLVERAPSAFLFHAPRHPYTRGLLASFPSLHGDREKLVGIPGSPVDLRHVPSGCAFRTRCPHEMPRCATDRPPLALPVGDPPSADREVACWLHDGRQPPPPSLARPAPAARPEYATAGTSTIRDTRAEQERS
ncbi:ABC transporter ATP-binding protein [Nakamurella endophytica]|uniref:Dipeptide/oligopeptide/nickel ABC transporter ATP-binding protein n=1 Tax=Nakamurella endophytica TaxID=1748367 RepID=A0A917SRV3_9ACTN|nr:ABC transporter ATP-binding protein [Nakamurella endophytica]GGL94454.1 dipeptide/oligopeptide/nickel ABC transporter ATP-binding protein [Nakamurella endophytica]